MDAAPPDSDRRAGRNPLRSRLGRRLLRWFIVLSLIPLLASNMLGYIESGRIIERLIGRQLSAMASVQAKHVRDQIDRLLNGLEVLAAVNPEFARAASGDAGEGGGVAAELERKLDELWEFDALFIEDPDGVVVASAGSVGALDGLTRSRLAQGGGSSLEVLEGRSPAGRPVFRMSVSLRPASPVSGLRLGALMGPRGLGGVLDIPPHLAGSIESFVLDASGRPLFVSHPHGYVDYSVPLATAEGSADEPDLARYEDRQGQEVFGISVPIEGLGWRYRAEFPVADALGPLRLLRRVSLILGTVFGVAVVAAAWIVSGNIVAPVRNLAHAAERVGAGELSMRIEPGMDDEIGDLGRAFDRMTANLEEAKKREEELHSKEIRRAQQLATVGELASGVAHEIKNPVAGIAGGLDLVSRRLGDDETLRPILDEMSIQIDRIGVAVRDLLTFARPTEPKRAPANPNLIVHRALTLVQPAAEKARVELRSEQIEAPVPVRVDGELIRQALVNLIVNALQATPAEGSVTVSLEQTEGETIFRVTDTGKGIPPEQLQDIFRPFYTTRHAGSGLGLSISRDIAERHGGRISVESAVGRGSTFTFRVPNQPGDEAT